MTNIEWMDDESYDLAEKIIVMLNKAYKQGVKDAWENVRTLQSDKGTFSFEWSADEMMNHCEKERKYRSEIEKIANVIGIHALYDIVKDMRGE